MIANYYIGRMLAKNIILFTLIPTVIMWIAQSRSIIPLIIKNDISFFLFLKLSAYMIPPLLPHLLPFSFALAALFLIYKLHQNNELTILWASGCSLVFLARPFLYSAGVVSLCIMVMNISIIPKISQQFRQEIFLVKTDVARSLLKAGVFQTPTKDIKIFIKDIRQSVNMAGFFLEDNSNPSVKRVFTAQKAVLLGTGEDMKILLLGGRMTEIPKDIKEMPSLLEFSHFTINLRAFYQKMNDNDDKAIIQDNFWNMITGHSANSREEYVRLLAKAHNYLTMAFYPLVYAMILIFILLRPLSPRFFPIRTLFYTAFAIIVTRMIGSALQNFANSQLEVIILTYVFPLLLIFLGGVYLLQKYYHSMSLKRML